MATARNGSEIALPAFYSGTRLRGCARAGTTRGLGFVVATATDLPVPREGGVILHGYGGGATRFTPPPITYTPPSVGSFSPAPNTTITPEQAIQFDVTSSALFVRILVTVLYATGVQEVAFDGRSFVGRYILSARETIPGGFRFTVRRVGGWASAPTIQAYAFDRAGNEGT